MLCILCHEKEAKYKSSRRCRECNTVYMREYKKKNHERVLEIKRKSRTKIRAESVLQRWKDYCNRSVKYALSNDKLIRKSCEVCEEFAEAHHDSYHREHILNVRWLCMRHHTEWHNSNEPEVPTNVQIEGYRADMQSETLKRREQARARLERMQLASAERRADRDKKRRTLYRTIFDAYRHGESVSSIASSMGIPAWKVRYAVRKSSEYNLSAS